MPTVKLSELDASPATVRRVKLSELDAAPESPDLPPPVAQEPTSLPPNLPVSPFPFKRPQDVGLEDVGRGIVETFKPKVFAERFKAASDPVNIAMLASLPFGVLPKTRLLGEGELPKELTFGTPGEATSVKIPFAPGVKQAEEEARALRPSPPTIGPLSTPKEFEPGAEAIAAKTPFPAVSTAVRQPIAPPPIRAAIKPGGEGQPIGETVKQALEVGGEAGLELLKGTPGIAALLDESIPLAEKPAAVAGEIAGTYALFKPLALAGKAPKPRILQSLRDLEQVKSEFPQAPAEAGALPPQQAPAVALAPPSPLETIRIGEKPKEPLPPPPIFPEPPKGLRGILSTERRVENTGPPISEAERRAVTPEVLAQAQVKPEIPIEPAAPESPKLAESFNPADFPPEVGVPTEMSFGGFGAVGGKGGLGTVPANKLAQAAAKHIQTYVIDETATKPLAGSWDAMQHTFGAISPGLRNVANKAFRWELERGRDLGRANAKIDDIFALTGESKEKIRQAAKGQLEPEKLTPVEQEKLAKFKVLDEDYRQRYIASQRAPLLKDLSPSQVNIIKQAANQPTPEAAAQFVRDSKYTVVVKPKGRKGYTRAARPFSENTAEVAAQYRELGDWGRQNHFPDLYPGHLRVLVQRENGNLQTISFAKDLRDAQVQFDQWAEMVKLPKDEKIKVSIFEKRTLPDALSPIIGKDAFKSYKAFMEENSPQIKLRTSRAGFFAAINKAAAEGGLSRDVAGKAIFEALYPRGAKKRFQFAQPKKLKDPLLGLADPEKAVRAYAFAFENKLMADKVRALAEPELAKLHDRPTKEWVEKQIDLMLGKPTADEIVLRDFAKKHNWDPLVIEKAARGWSYIVTATKLGFANLRFPLLNKSQMINTWALAGEKSLAKGIADGVASYKQGTWQNKLWNETGFAETPIAIEGTNLPLHIRGAGKAVSIAKEIPTFMVKASEMDNYRQSFFAFLDAAKRLGYEGDEAFGLALNGVRDTQFPGGRAADIPALRSRIVKGTVGQFQSYGIKQARFYGKLLRGKPITEAQLTSPMGAAARQLTGTLAAGGVKAFTNPFLIAGGLPAYLLTQTGILPAITAFLGQTYDDVKEKFGERAAQMFFAGLPAAAGVDISGSVAPNIPFMSPSGKMGFPGLSIAQDILELGPAGVKKNLPMPMAPIPKSQEGRYSPEEKIARKFGFQPSSQIREQLERDFVAAIKRGREADRKRARANQ